MATLWHIISFLIGSVFGAVFGAVVGVIAERVFGRFEEKPRPHVSCNYVRKGVGDWVAKENGYIDIVITNRGITTIPPGWPKLYLQFGGEETEIGTVSGVYKSNDLLPNQSRTYRIGMGIKPTDETYYFTSELAKHCLDAGGTAVLRFTLENSDVVIWESEKVGHGIVKITAAAENGSAEVPPSLVDAANYKPLYFPDNVVLLFSRNSLAEYLRSLEIRKPSSVALAVLLLYGLMIWAFVGFG